MGLVAELELEMRNSRDVCILKEKFVQKIGHVKDNKKMSTDIIKIIPVCDTCYL